MKKVNPLGKPVSPARRRFLKLTAGAVVGLGTPTYAAEWEPEQIEVVHRSIPLAGWPVVELRVGHLSDLHCQSRRAVSRTARAAQLLLKEKPDVVFLTGDFISGQPAARWAAACADALAPLRSVPGGVFAVLGNHDWTGQGAVTRELEQVGFTVLRNRAAPLPSLPGVWAVGLDSRSVDGQDMAQALQGVPSGAVKLLLVHEPDFADEAPEGFTLQLSGHSHAGQIRVPGLPPLHCPTWGRKYPEGLQKTLHHPVYTTRGIGMIGPQMRFCCPPEVTVLTLRPKG